MKPLNIKKLTTTIQPQEFKLCDPNEVSSKTCEFVERLYNSTTDVILDFLNTKTQKCSLRDNYSKLYIYENVLMYRSNGIKSLNLEQNIKTIQNQKLTPKFVQYFQLGEDDFLTVMEVNEKNIIPYNKAADKVNPTTKLTFKNEVQKFIQKDLINKEIFANRDALLVTDDYKEIVFADWAQIDILAKNEKLRINEFLKNWHI